jgi:hypothetical protein
MNKVCETFVIHICGTQAIWLCYIEIMVCRADNLTTFMCWFSWNLGASTSWNPMDLSRPVMGLLYLYLLHWDNIELQHMQTQSMYWAVNSALGNPVPATLVNLSQLWNSVIFLRLCRSFFHTLPWAAIIFVICSSCIVDSFQKRNYLWIAVCSFSCWDGWDQGGCVEGQESRHTGEIIKFIMFM